MGININRHLWGKSICLFMGKKCLHVHISLYTCLLQKITIIYIFSWAFKIFPFSNVPKNLVSFTVRQQYERLRLCWTSIIMVSLGSIGAETFSQTKVGPWTYLTLWKMLNIFAILYFHYWREGCLKETGLHTGQCNYCLFPMQLFPV